MTFKKVATATSITILASVEAKIKQDGPWTGHDWYDSTKNIGVKDGEPYSTDSQELRRIMSPRPIDGDPKDRDWESFENVITVKGFIKDAA